MEETLSKCVERGGKIRGSRRLRGRRGKWGGKELLNGDVTGEEVKQALDTLKQKAVPGSDRLTAEMVCSGILVDFWRMLEVKRLWWSRSTSILGVWLMSTCKV